MCVSVLVVPLPAAAEFVTCPQTPGRCDARNVIDPPHFVGCAAGSGNIQHGTEASTTLLGTTAIYLRDGAEGTGEVCTGSESYVSNIAAWRVWRKVVGGVPQAECPQGGTYDVVALPTTYMRTYTSLTIGTPCSDGSAVSIGDLMRLDVRFLIQNSSTPYTIYVGQHPMFNS